MYKKVVLLVAFLFFVTITIQPAEAWSWDNKITSASWSLSSATEGDFVTLTIKTDSSLNGKWVKFDVWEKDLISNDEHVAYAGGTYVKNGVATKSWQTIWQLDGYGDFGLNNNPEYYFVANVGEYERDSGKLLGLLSVKQKPCASDEERVGNKCEKKKEITSITWSKSAVYDGDSVDITVKAQGLDGQWIDLKIYEREPWGTVDTGTTLSAKVSSGTAKALWKAKWVNDGIGQNDPEFVVKITVGSQTKQSDIVKVSKKPCSPDETEINGVCVKQKIDSVYWDKSSVYTGDSVKSTVETSGLPNKDLELEIWEDGSGKKVGTLYGKTDSNGKLTKYWTAKWEDDGASGGWDPEYYIKAKYGTLYKTSGDLSVSNKCSSDETKIQGRCVRQEIKSVSWSVSEAKEGDKVKIVIETSGLDGQQATIKIYEDDPEILGGSNDLIRTTSKTVSGNRVEEEWVTEWGHEGPLQGDPEYFIKVEIGGKSKTSGNLNVRNKCASDQTRINNNCVSGEIKNAYWKHKSTTVNSGDKVYLVAETTLPEKTEIIFDIYRDYPTEERKNIIKDNPGFLTTYITTLKSLVGSDSIANIEFEPEWITKKGLLDETDPTYIFKASLGEKYKVSDLLIVRKKFEDKAIYPNKVSLSEFLNMTEVFLKEKAQNPITGALLPNKGFYIIVPDHFSEEQKNGIKEALQNVYRSQLMEDIPYKLDILDQVKESCPKAIASILFPLDTLNCISNLFSGLEIYSNPRLLEPKFIKSSEVPYYCSQNSGWDAQVIIFGNEKNNNAFKCYPGLDKSEVMSLHNSPWYTGYKSLIFYIDDSKEDALLFAYDVFLSSSGFTLLEPETEDDFRWEYLLFDPRGCKSGTTNDFSFSDRTAGKIGCAFEVVMILPWGKIGKIGKFGGLADDLLKVGAKNSDDILGKLVLKSGKEAINEAGEAATKRGFYLNLKKVITQNKDELYRIAKNDPNKFKKSLDIIRNSEIKWGDNALKTLFGLSADDSTLKFLDKYKANPKLLEEFLDLTSGGDRAKLLGDAIAKRIANLDGTVKMTDEAVSGLIKMGKTVVKLGIEISYKDVSDGLLPKLGNIFADGSMSQKIEKIKTVYKLDGFKIIFKDRIIDPDDAKAVIFGEIGFDNSGVVKEIFLSIDDFREYGIYVTKEIIRDGIFVEEAGHLVINLNLEKITLKLGKDPSKLWPLSKTDKEVYRTLHEYLVEVFHKGKLTKTEEEAFERTVKELKLGLPDTPNPQALRQIAKNYLMFVRYGEKTEDTLFAIRLAALSEDYKLVGYADKLRSFIREEYLKLGGKNLNKEMDKFDTLVSELRKLGEEVNKNILDNHDVSFVKKIEDYLINKRGLVWGVLLLPPLGIDTSATEESTNIINDSSIISTQPTSTPNPTRTCSTDDFTFSWSQCINGWQAGVYTKKVGVDCDGISTDSARQACTTITSQPVIPVEPTPQPSTPVIQPPQETDDKQQTPNSNPIVSSSKPTQQPPQNTPTITKPEYDSKAKIKIYNSYSADYKVRINIIRDGAAVKTEVLELAKLSDYETLWLNLDSGKYTISVEWENKQTGLKDKTSQELILKNGRNRVVTFNIKDFNQENIQQPTNTAVTQPQIPKLPDLVVEEIKLKKTTIRSGSYIPIQFTLRNVGEAAAKNIKWRISDSDSSIEKSLAEIQPGGFVVVIEFIKLSSLGTHKIEIIVDPENSILESREDNKESIEVAVV
ncbi:MAG: hypothetical protein HY512_00980 [Candidatus Aenigmarchaeota archaeon]|nr:hypothetical protein [Candidatus Aenigmarchaeota archaeon]